MKLGWVKVWKRGVEGNPVELFQGRHWREGETRESQDRPKPFRVIAGAPPDVPRDLQDRFKMSRR